MERNYIFRTELTVFLKNHIYYVVEKAFSAKGISKWQKLKNHAAAYARATTLHGFAYMGETERHWIEKYIFSNCFMAKLGIKMIMFCIFYI